MCPLTLLALEALDLAEAAMTPRRSPIDELLSRVQAEGSALLADLAHQAVARLLASPSGISPQGTVARLFNDDELLLLAEELASVKATSELLARSQVADHGERVRRRKARTREALTPGRLETRLLEGVQTFVPEAALDFFRGLFPLLGTDVGRFLPDLRRTAFTLVVATDTELLRAVQDAIADRIESGDTLSGPLAVQAILDAAEVSPRNSGYASSVFRTNAMDSYNQGYQDQLSAEHETFPVWRYSAVADNRSRKWHAEKNGRYYPSTVPFTQVRGTEAKDVINCRCVPIAIDRWEWAELKAAGARIADGYQDVPANAGLAMVV